MGRSGLTFRSFAGSLEFFPLPVDRFGSFWVA